MLETPLTSSTKRHIHRPQNNAKLGTPFPMLAAQMFSGTHDAPKSTPLLGVMTPPPCNTPTHAPRTDKKSTINFAACVRRNAPKNAEKRRITPTTPKNAEKRAPNRAEFRRKGAFQQAEKQPNRPSDAGKSKLLTADTRLLCFGNACSCNTGDCAKRMLKMLIFHKSPPKTATPVSDI